MLYTAHIVFSYPWGGATTNGPDATPPPPKYLSKRGGGLGDQFWGGFGLRVCGGGGGFGRKAGVPKVGGGGGLRATHYYHMHTSRGDVCLGVWGYRGMYVIMALSRLCREESLKGRRVAPLPPSSFPLPPSPLFPRAPRSVCEKNS